MIYIKSCPVANRHGRKIMFRREQEENKMELCYDGALVLPSSYAVMDEEEMTYTEGGGSRTYRGNQGWAAAVALTSAGLFLSGMGKAVGVTIIRGCIGGGPIAWICGIAATVAIMYGSGALGGQMYSAGFQALYCMAKKGKFTLKTTSNPFGLFSVF